MDAYVLKLPQKRGRVRIDGNSGRLAFSAILTFCSFFGPLSTRNESVSPTHSHGCSPWALDSPFACISREHRRVSSARQAHVLFVSCRAGTSPVPSIIPSFRLVAQSGRLTSARAVSVDTLLTRSKTPILYILWTISLPEASTNQAFSLPLNNENEKKKENIGGVLYPQSPSCKGFSI